MHDSEKVILQTVKNKIIAYFKQIKFTDSLSKNPFELRFKNEVKNYLKINFMKNILRQAKSLKSRLEN